MTEVPVTEFRRNLPAYLRRVRGGEELLLTSRGEVVARLTPQRNVQESAREALRALRNHARVGDVLAPIDATWGANDARP